MYFARWWRYLEIFLLLLQLDILKNNRKEKNDNRQIELKIKKNLILAVILGRTEDKKVIVKTHSNRIDNGLLHQTFCIIQSDYVVPSHVWIL